MILNSFMGQLTVFDIFIVVAINLVKSLHKRKIYVKSFQYFLATD